MLMLNLIIPARHRIVSFLGFFGHGFQISFTVFKNGNFIFGRIEFSLADLI